MLEEEIYQKVRLEEDVTMLKSQILQLGLDADQVQLLTFLIFLLTT